MTVLDTPSLAVLAAETGTSVPCAGNLPLDMSDPQFVWFVEEGTVDIFIVERKDQVEQAAPQHLLRAETGRLLPGVAPNVGPTTLSLIAKGLPGTILRRISVASLSSIDDANLAEQVDSWVRDVSAMLSRYDTEATRSNMLVETGEAPMASNGVISARSGVVWLSGLLPGTGLFLGLLDPTDSRLDGGDMESRIPLVRDTWIMLAEPQQLSVHSSEKLAEEGLLIPALAHFHDVALLLERLNRGLAVVDEVNLERERVTNRQSDEIGARHRLFDLYNLSEDTGTGSRGAALLDALGMIGQHEGINFKLPEKADTSNSSEFLAHILDISGVRARRVRLNQGKNSLQGCSGAMLGFREEDQQPVALLPSMLGGYRIVDPAGHHSTRVTANNAGSLCTEAWLFYQPLSSAPAGLRDLLQLAFRGSSMDFLRFFVTGLLGGLVMLLPALILGFVADEVIPGEEVRLLYEVCVALAVIALLGALLHVLQGMALMRIEGRAASRAEAALWDRLLRLPPRILHRYSAGDLTMRGMTFQTLRDAVQNVVANGGLTIVFLLPVFFVTFLYDPMLGGITVVFGLISLAATVALGLRQMAPHGRMVRAMQKLAGQLFQIINGISVLRVEGAEGSAFAVWAQGYREQKLAELERNAVEEHVQALSAAIPILAGAVLLAAGTLPDREAFTVGDFLVIYTVFMVFQGAVARLGASFGAVAAVMPAVDQIRPFLTEPPETDAAGEPVETLTGDIRLDHVSFRYDSDGPLILDNISIHARPGQFIAITGESGAGKSTLFQLMLGLDNPTSGAVYFDGRDLRHLNVKQVRRKIGAIPQTVQLYPEDVWDNIVGGHDNANGEEVWRAAQLAAVDQEISAMPMEMLTFVGAGGGVTSGGESQRIMIARALLHHPRILLLDEATNWLDNESQSKVMVNLAKLSATRIIIAHRLSTLRQADHIYVMQAGKVVEEGNFSDLMKIEGVFKSLVRRQLA